jgi:hypothetical protein
MNLEGKSFGRLTVVRNDPSNRRRWECRCSCGESALVYDSNLTSGKTSSCGCMNREANTIPAGTRFKRLVVLGVGPDRKEAKRRRAQSRCLCDCGRETLVTNRNLLVGCTKSCGCLAKERASNWRKKHGLHATGTYSSWSAMMKRCYNPKSFGYRIYGGRGIKVCDRWHDVLNFVADMGERPEGMSIDRINADGDYEPGNVRWATCVEQNNNRRGVSRFDVFGGSLSIGEMSARSGVKHATVAARLKRGWTPAEAMRP